jgi:Gas vesicle synthesis protein GvpL/GvpF
VADELALWLYCVVRRDDELPTGLPGVDPRHAVQRIERDGLAALVSRVPLDEFGAEPLRRNLNDLGWLERVARAHEAVLERALGRATIVPVRLCTIFDGEDGALQLLEDEREALEEALDALRGRGEWSVKLLVDRSALLAAAGDGESEAGAEGAGAAYLLRRRREREARDLADRMAADLARDVHARLCDEASDAVVSPPQNRSLSGHEGDMLLNGAYLVDEGALERLREVVTALEERHRDLGARLELRGPFPPYNFVQRPRATRA